MKKQPQLLNHIYRDEEQQANGLLFLYIMHEFQVIHKCYSTFIQRLALRHPETDFTSIATSVKPRGWGKANLILINYDR